MDHQELKIGDRVRLNALGEQSNAGLKNRTGVITGRTRGSGYYVLMDGNKTASRLHRSYLEPDQPPLRTTACAS
jgi:hypothetical protein